MISQKCSLLAKRPANPSTPLFEETLVGHTERVYQMADRMVHMLAPRLTDLIHCENEEIKWWKHAVRVAAWIHDWGKANDHFQKMMHSPNFRQGVRHEVISLVLTQDLAEWLEPIWHKSPSWVKCAALFSVAGHHLKFPDPAQDSRTGTEVSVLMDHSDFLKVLRLGVDRFGLLSIGNLKKRTFSLLYRGDLKKILSNLHKQLDLHFNDHEKFLIAATKSLVMAADLAGSALPLKKPDSVEWIEQRLNQILMTQQLEQVVKKKLDDKSPREFQLEVKNAQCPTVLVEAGCGSGKTAAAYLWASRHADGKRLFFCYPTTGTATEGFAGYLSDSDFDAILIHSRSDTDYRLLPNMPEPGNEENELKEAGLEALETWPIPAVVCTAHTVLGILENVRRGLYAFPSMLQSVFVFDEVHAFSDKLFSYLLRFLQSFPGVPVLLMTATLPPKRREALEKCCLNRSGIHVIKGPEKRESAKRYILYKSSFDEAWSETEKCLQAGGKVLWVSNTVKRTLEILDEASKRELPVEPYHSRYRYKDRLKRHRKLIDGFAGGNPALLGVTTQVAEMSLDLSADLLISDWAPIPSMIQRLGRLNRFQEEPKYLKKALFLKPENIRPYGEEEMEGIDEWFSHVADGKPKSQLELAEAFVSVSEKDGSIVEPAKHCEWLDGLWRSLKDQRAIEEATYTMEIIREEDLGTGSGVELAIPMPIPKHLNWREWGRQGRYLVAPSCTINYDSFRGAEWK